MSLILIPRYPPNTDQKKKDLGAWFGKHPPTGVAEALPKYVEALNAKYPSVKSWAVLGVSDPSTSSPRGTNMHAQDPYYPYPAPPLPFQDSSQ